MDFAELLTSSIEALKLNKLRTALATLGIIIGIGSVIALVSIGQASQAAVTQQIEALGSNLITVIPGALRPGNIQSAGGTSTTLTLADANAIKNSRNIPGVVNVSPEMLRRAQVTAGRNNTNTQVVGVTEAFAEAHNVQIENGSFITDSDNSGQRKVAVLGPQVVTDLFGEGSNPIGQTIRINRASFRVVGTTVSKGGSGLGGNQDDVVYVPLSVAQKQLFGVDYLGTISIQVDNPDNSDAVRDGVGYLLVARHKIADPANADFTIFSQQDILGAAQQITGVFTILLSGIAAISLLVGGIGIMNIMLVTVTERTREIGLRKALGASKNTIVAQFLIESIILTCVGGFLGMTIGITASFLVTSLALKLPFSLSITSIILAIGVSGGIGILFGWYPARKASNMSPIEALRYE